MQSSKKPTSKSARIIPGRIVVCATSDHLDVLEQHTTPEGKVARELGVTMQTASVQAEANPPSIYSYQDNPQGWQKVIPQKPLQAADLGKLVGDIAGEAALFAAFQQTQATHTLNSRTFKFNPALKSVAEVTAELDKMINKPNTLGVTGYDISPDHLVRHAGGHFPGDSPWKIPARPFEPDPLTHGEPQTLFKSQSCWEMIGATERADFAYKGDGVTVVIVDTAPPLDHINPDLVDFVITIKDSDADLAGSTAGGEESAVNLKALYNMGRVHPKPLKRPGGADIEVGLMEPYHGLLIASLIRELAPAARIILVEGLNDTGEGSASSLTVALEYIQFLRDGKWFSGEKRLVEDNLVYNLSLGLSRTSAEEVEALYLLQSCERLSQKGALIVAAAGNDSYYLHPRNPEEPAAYGYFCDSHRAFDNVIAVSASGVSAGEYALFSNQGNLAAPGMDLLMDSGDEQNPAESRFVYWSGTSFSTPLVSAASALLLSAGVPHGKVKQMLWKGSTPPETWHEVTRLNVAISLSLAAATPADQTAPISTTL